MPRPTTAVRLQHSQYPSFRSTLAAMSSRQHHFGSTVPSLPLSKDHGHFHLDSDRSQSLDLRKVREHNRALIAKYRRHESHLGRGEEPLAVQGSAAAWTGEMTLGSSEKAKPVRVILDTGSADLILPKESLDLSEAKKTDKKVTTGYGDGTKAEGTVYLDDLKIADVGPIKDVAVGVTDRAFIPHRDNSRTAAVGIAGMAYPVLSTFGSAYPPFFDSILKAKALKQGLFSFVLASASESERKGSGDKSEDLEVEAELKTEAEAARGGATTGLRSEMTLGFISPQLTSSVCYVPLSRKVYWQIPLSLNGLDIQGVMDTGTTLIYGQEDLWRKFLLTLPQGSYETVEPAEGQGDIYAVLAHGAEVPEIKFTIGDLTIKLKEEEVIIGKDDKGRRVLSVWGNSTGLLKDPKVWLVGDSFLRSVVSVWDRENDRFGVGPHKDTLVVNGRD